MRYFHPKDATVAITYQCNARCTMCNIWQKKSPPVMPAEYFENLSPDLLHINISGGEPFLHPDLPAIAKIIKRKCPRASIDISSNGIATELIIDTVKKISKIDPKIGVRISLDGLKDTHDRIRGLPGVFDAAMATIAGLRKLKITNLGFGFTIQDENAGELIKVYDLARQMNLQLSLALVQNSELYFSKTSNKLNLAEKISDSLDQIIKKELSGWKLKNWLRAYFDYGLKHNFLTGLRLLPSGAGYDSMFIDPSGDVYPSMLIGLKMGNLGQEPLDKIWNSTKAGDIREKMMRESISESWVICTVRQQIRQNKFKVLWWILKNKLFGYEGSANK